MESLLPHKVLQIAFVVDDVETHLKMFATLFGIEAPSTNITGSFEETQSLYLGAPTEGRAKVGYIPLENILLEFIEPVDGPSIWADFLEKNGNGIHHLAFIVDGCSSRLLTIWKTSVCRFYKKVSLPRPQMLPSGKYAYLQGLEKLGFDVELLEFDA